MEEFSLHLLHLSQEFLLELIWAITIRLGFAIVLIFTLSLTSKT